MATRQLTREERVAQIKGLAATSLTHQQIAELLGISKSALRNLLYDSDGSQARARKDRYRGTCQACGAKTDGSNGAAKAPKYCLRCAPAAYSIPCPSYASYARGCRCEGCREAMRERRSRWVAGRSGDIPHGTKNGYTNYGCRCDACREVATVAERAYRRERLERARPEDHGTHKLYSYGCRCDACRAAGPYPSRADRARRRKRPTLIRPNTRLR